MGGAKVSVFRQNVPVPTYVPVTLTATGWSAAFSRVGNVVTAIITATAAPSGSPPIPAAFQPLLAEVIGVGGGFPTNYIEVVANSAALTGNLQAFVVGTPTLPITLTMQWLATPPVIPGQVPLYSFPLLSDGPTGCSLALYRGDTFTRTFLFADSTGNAIPLQGTWTAQVRQSVDAASPLTSFVVDASQAAVGIITISLDAPTTAALTAGAWDLQETDTSGTVTTWLHGTVSVAPDVTR